VERRVGVASEFLGVATKFDPYTLGTVIGKAASFGVECMKLITRDRKRRNAVPCKYICTDLVHQHFVLAVEHGPASLE
jgi:hypothetical protein